MHLSAFFCSPSLIVNVEKSLDGKSKIKNQEKYLKNENGNWIEKNRYKSICDFSCVFSLKIITRSRTKCKYFFQKDKAYEKTHSKFFQVFEYSRDRRKWFHLSNTRIIWFLVKMEPLLLKKRWENEWKKLHIFLLCWSSIEFLLKFSLAKICTEDCFVLFAISFSTISQILIVQPCISSDTVKKSGVHDSFNSLLIAARVGFIFFITLYFILDFAITYH